MYARSLLVLRALTDRRSGAVAAGARDGWAYVWPRDAAAVAIALAGAGYRAEARRVGALPARPRPRRRGPLRRRRRAGRGRAAQGDAAGWVAAAARAAGMPPHRPRALAWRDRADYQEKSPGDYLANAIAVAVRPGDGAQMRGFVTRRGLVREVGDPGSGLDSAAAWAVRPFPQPALFPAARRTLLAARRPSGGRFGIVPSEDWPRGRPLDGADGLERLEPRRPRRAPPGAARCWRDLRRAATPPALLPERVDARTGVPRSTTPLAWSHAFAILALRELWPGRTGGRTGGLRLGRWRCRPATIEDCGAIARGMKVVVDEGRWLATEAGRPRSRTSSSGSAPRSSGTGSSSSCSRTAGSWSARSGCTRPSAAGVLSLGMWVLPGWRGRGGGRMLIEAALAARARRRPQGRARGLPRQRGGDRPLPLARLRGGGAAARPLPPRGRLAALGADHGAAVPR